MFRGNGFLRTLDVQICTSQPHGVVVIHREKGEGALISIVFLAFGSCGDSPPKKGGSLIIGGPLALRTQSNCVKCLSLRWIRGVLKDISLFVCDVCFSERNENRNSNETQ